jgi:anti-sigma B factor antagonist
MSDSPLLTVTTDSSEPELSLMSVAGEIDMLSAPELTRHLDEMIARGVPVVVDLSAVSFIDSSGLSELHRASDTGRVVLVVEPAAKIARVVALSGFAERVPVCGDVAAARRLISDGN